MTAEDTAEIAAFLEARLADEEANVGNCAGPARILREIEAKRRIIAALKRTEAGEVRTWHYAATSGQIEALRWVVRTYAEMHSDHPDYPRPAETSLTR